MALNDTLNIDDSITNYSKTSVSSLPTSAFPLDARSYFETKADALEAAKSAVPQGSTEGIYYIGMPIVVMESADPDGMAQSGMSLYIIGEPVKVNGNIQGNLSLVMTLPDFLNIGIKTFLNRTSIKAGSNINITVDDANNTVTINSTSSGGGTVLEGVQSVTAEAGSGIVANTDGSKNVTLSLETDDIVYILDSGSAQDILTAQEEL